MKIKWASLIGHNTLIGRERNENRAWHLKSKNERTDEGKARYKFYCFYCKPQVSKVHARTQNNANYICFWNMNIIFACVRSETVQQGKKSF